MNAANAAPIFDQPAATPAATARDEAPQYVLPLVVRIERDAPPQRTDALETAARAVLTFLADPRVTEADGEWAALVRAWTDGRIRKVVRRARGAEWRRASALAPAGRRSARRDRRRRPGSAGRRRAAGPASQG